jgi:hypothetical protein
MAMLLSEFTIIYVGTSGFGEPVVGHFFRQGNELKGGANE